MARFSNARPETVQWTADENIRIQLAYVQRRTWLACHWCQCRHLDIAERKSLTIHTVEGLLTLFGQFRKMQY